MKVQLFDRYGGMKPGIYELVSKNYDHYVVKWRGSNYCVPTNLFERDNRVYEAVFQKPESSFDM